MTPLSAALPSAVRPVRTRVTYASRRTGSRAHGQVPGRVAGVSLALVLGSAVSASAQAPAVGGRLRVVRSGVEGTAVVAAPLPPVDTMPARRMGPACGTARACAAAWDLRIARISSADSVGAGGLLRTTITLENAGRLAAPASEILLCVTAGGYRCENTPGGGVRIAIPALRSAEQLVVTRDLRVVAGRAAMGRTKVSAMIDPERRTGETIWADNYLTRDVQVELPDLAVSTLAPAPETQGVLAVNAPLVIDVRVTNRGRAVTAPATDVALSAGDSQGNNTFCGPWGDPDTRLPVPALAPGQAWTARVIVSGRAVSCKASDFAVSARLDPDGRETWSLAMRLDAARPYTVR